MACRQLAHDLRFPCNPGCQRQHVALERLIQCAKGVVAMSDASFDPSNAALLEFEYPEMPRSRSTILKVD